jgi:hypothetical protein
MRVFLNPTGIFSRAMVRVANNLANYAPSSISISGSPSHLYTDLQILHVIGYDAIEYAKNLLSRGQKYAVIQYCLNPLNESPILEWFDLWRNAQLVWSYYDLNKFQLRVDFNFYHAPLGIDQVFIDQSERITLNQGVLNQSNRDSILTSGYVSSPAGEAIEEVWRAAKYCNIPVIHLGPKQVEGIPDSLISSYPTFKHEISDEELSYLYSRSLYVSGLRHVEGFELPALEGLICGARPVLFDHECYRHWYRNRAIYIPDCSGERLVDYLVNIFKGRPHEVTEATRLELIRKFSWKAICEGFWNSLLKDQKK